jgi:hypothetical protein
LMDLQTISPNCLEIRPNFWIEMGDGERGRGRT